MAIEYVLKDDDDGAVIGASTTVKIAFWGGTPAVRSTIGAAVDSTGVVSTSLAYGFSTSTQGDALVARVNEIRNLLVLHGITA